MIALYEAGAGKRERAWEAEREREKERGPTDDAKKTVMTAIHRNPIMQKGV